MQLTQLLLSTTLFASTAVMATPIAGVSMMVSGSEWTITNMKRVCNKDDTCCTWTFGIDVGSGANSTTPCTYVVEADSDASRADGGPSQCGAYTITSGWSDQFGEDHGFTTLSIVNDKTPRQIIWPAYTDEQLEGGQVVKPDQSYAPATLP